MRGLTRPERKIQMTVQMFDLFLQVDVEGEIPKPKFVMRAPLAVIGRYLSLYRNAERRVENETGPFTMLYYNNHSGAGEPGTYIVQKAFTEMGVTR
jgi:hypothetical protein